MSGIYGDQPEGTVEPGGPPPAEPSGAPPVSADGMVRPMTRQPRADSDRGRLRMIVPLTQTSQRPLPRLEPAPQLPQWHTIAGAEAAACRGQVIPDYDEFKQWKEAGGQSAFDADKVPPSTRILGAAARYDITHAFGRPPGPLAAPPGVVATGNGLATAKLVWA